MKQHLFAYLFLQTKQDSYEFPSTRTVIIRKFIQNLDEQIEANLPEEDHPDEHRMIHLHLKR